MIAFSATQSENASVNNSVGLMKLLKDWRTELNAVNTLIDNSLLKNMEKLRPKDLYGLIQTIEAHKISKPIFFDLLATQFSRAQTINEFT